MLIDANDPRDREILQQIAACRRAREEWIEAASKADLQEAIRLKSIYRDRCQGLYALLDSQLASSTLNGHSKETASHG